MQPSDAIDALYPDCWVELDDGRMIAMTWEHDGLPEPCDGYDLTAEEREDAIGLAFTWQRRQYMKYGRV